MFDPPEEETDIPRLQIFCCAQCLETPVEGHPDCCPEMIQSIKACNYDKPRNNKPSEDVAEFEGDDPYDDIRYACDTAERYYEEASEEFKRVQREALIIQQLNNTQDWTAYYRNMRTIEAGTEHKMVSRFHRR